MAWSGCCGAEEIFVILILYCIISRADIIDNDAEPGIISCEKENTTIFQGNRTFWQLSIHSYHSKIANNGTRCHTTCPIDCTCTLGNVMVTRECKTSPTTEASIQYPSYVLYYLSWRGSIIHAIKPQAFLSIGDEVIGLDLNNVGLQYLERGVFDGLQSLEFLILMDNYIAEITPGVFNELQSFDSLTESINDTFSILPNLRVLYLSNNQLTELAPGAFGMLPKLTYLDLSHNQLIELAPGIISALQSFEWLHLSYNQLTELLSGTFNMLPNLSWLDLSNNQLTEIAPDTFTELQNLTKLYLDNNKLTEVAPGTFSELHNLYFLRLSFNQLANVSSDGFTGLSSLAVLQLSQNKLAEIHAGIFNELSNLIELYLSSNHLTEIPFDAFKKMKKLGGLDLSNNSLSEIAPHVSSMMPSNMVPGLFGQFIDLKQLNLSYNKLSTLHSNTFQNQSMLKHLDISHNRLAYLPEDIFHNKIHLEHLDLSWNRLTRIPNALFSSLNLQRLNVYSNPLFWIEPNALVGLNKTVDLIVSDHSVCCFTSANCVCDKAPSPFLTCKRLLPFNSLRIAVWLVGILTLLGNCMIFYIRYRHMQRGVKVQDLLIINLSISDFCMGIYLVMPVAADMYYTHYFPSLSASWRSSVL